MTTATVNGDTLKGGALLVGALVLGFVVYKVVGLLGLLGNKVKDAGDALGTKIGDAIAPVIVGKGVVALGEILMPNGGIVTVDQISKGSGIDENGQFTWMGKRYQVHSNFNGTYYATSV